MDGTFASHSKRRFSDPVELVKDHLGSVAAEHVRKFEPKALERMIVTFPEGPITVLYSLEEQTVEVLLPGWAKELGWEIVP